MFNIDPNQNYFQLFGLPTLFVVDVAELKSRYKNLQREVHPDRHTACGATEQRLAVQYSALLNQAYEILQDPVRRAIYMLKLEKVNLNSNSAEQLSPRFLMEQIELREALQDIVKAVDPLRELQVFQSRMSGKIEELVAICESQFAAENLGGAAETVSKMQFYRKLLQSAKDMSLRYENK